MNQLLDIQRLELQKGAATNEGEAKALTDSKRLFLSNQAKYQDLNDDLRICGSKPGRSKIRTAEFAFNWKIRGHRLTGNTWAC